MKKLFTVFFVLWIASLNVHSQQVTPTGTCFGLKSLFTVDSAYQWVVEKDSIKKTLELIDGNLVYKITFLNLKDSKTNNQLPNVTVNLYSFFKTIQMDQGFQLIIKFGVKHDMSSAKSNELLKNTIVESIQKALAELNLIHVSAVTQAHIEKAVAIIQQDLQKMHKCPTGRPRGK